MSMLTRRGALATLAPTSWAAHAAPRPGVGEIVLGQSAPLSGPFAALGVHYRNGAMLAIDQANRSGGVHGRSLRLITMDDAYNADRAATNARALLDEHGAIGFLNHMFTNTVRASWPIARDAGACYLGPYTGHTDLYRTRHPLLVLTRASFDDELARILDYVSTVGYQRIGLAYYDNAVGLELKQDVEAGLKQRGGKVLAVSAALPIGGAQAAPAAAKALNAQSPDAMLLGVSGTDAVALIQAQRAAGARPVYFARSLVGSRQLHDALGREAQGIVVSQLVPSPARAGLPVVAEYRRLLRQRQANAEPDFVELEGFFNAKAMLQTLERLPAGEAPTRRSLADAVSALGRVDLGGHVLDFGGGRRSGSRYVELTMLRSDGTFAQ
jgi:branched-chain amino acid transport system substrate-binding protein